MPRPQELAHLFSTKADAATVEHELEAARAADATHGRYAALSTHAYVGYSVFCGFRAEVADGPQRPRRTARLDASLALTMRYDSRAGGGQRTAAEVTQLEEMLHNVRRCSLQVPLPVKVPREYILLLVPCATLSTHRYLQVYSLVNAQLHALQVRHATRQHNVRPATCAACASQHNACIHALRGSAARETLTALRYGGYAAWLRLCRAARTVRCTTCDAQAYSLPTHSATECTTHRRATLHCLRALRCATALVAPLRAVAPCCAKDGQAVPLL